MSGEEAFLASLGTGEPAEPVVDDNEPQSDEEDYDPTGSDDKGSASEAYDPLAPVVALSDEPLETLAPPSQAVSRSATHTPAVSTPLPTKPVTIGGFVTEDSDEEGEATQTSGAVALETVKSPSQAPVSNSPAPPMAQQSAASLSVPVPANGVSPSPAPTPANGASAPVPVSIPKTRLPNDIVGIFEDRIAEDPKGDSEAWMGLIAHLRSKAKYDEVRKVYARFFEVFPTAVRHPTHFFPPGSDTSCRATNGLRTPGWNSSWTTSRAWKPSSTKPFSKSRASSFGASTLTTCVVATTS